MARVRFTDVQAHPAEFLDLTSSLNCPQCVEGGSGCRRARVDPEKARLCARDARDDGAGP